MIRMMLARSRHARCSNHPFICHEEGPLTGPGTAQELIMIGFPDNRTHLIVNVNSSVETHNEKCSASAHSPQVTPASRAGPLPEAYLNISMFFFFLFSMIMD
jgi:hypothetical protein